MKHNNKPNLLYFESWMKGHAIKALKDDNSINLIRENFSRNISKLQQLIAFKDELYLTPFFLKYFDHNVCHDQQYLSIFLRFCSL